MTDFTVTEATPDLARRLQLRELDRLEVSLALPGVDPRLVVEESIKHSDEAWAAFEGDEVIAIGGYSVMDHMVGPWLLCGDGVARHGKTAVRAGRGLLEFLRRTYPDKLIGNHVARSNKAAQVYIKALGFVILPTPGESNFDFFYLPHVL